VYEPLDYVRLNVRPSEPEEGLGYSEPVTLHPLAARFSEVAAVYERGRPDYAPAVAGAITAELRIPAGGLVLDLAAGTGKLTRALLSAGLDVVAVEPQPPLREVLAAAVGSARVRDGLAEAIPLPDGSVDARIDDEWSFAQTLRHLVHGIDLWLGKSVLGRAEADFHPLGLGYGSRDLAARSYDDVLVARADRVAMVRDFLATVTDEVLDEERRNPHNPAKAETVRHCLHVILDEGWEHLRFALRDLDVIAHA